MQNLSNCPICNGASIENYTEIKDYAISGEIFSLSICKDCTFVFTNPRPDNQEIIRYYQSDNYISHHSNEKGMVTSVYRKIRNIMLKRKVNLINSLATSKIKTLLDIGCGTGEFLNKATKEGWITLGLEPDTDALNSAIENYGLDVKSPQELFTIKPSTFDIISMWHVLEHVHLLNEYLSSIYQILKPAGSFIVAVPNYISEDSKVYGKYWAGWDVPRHLYHFNRTTLEKLGNKHGFKLSHILPMPFDAYYVSLKSEEYKGNKLSAYMLGAINGVRSNTKAASTGEYSSLIYVFSKD